MLSIDTWRTIGLCVIASGQTSFALLYMTFPWWRSFLGRALFYKGVTLATIVDLGLTARLFPNLLHWDVLFIVLYFLLGAGVWFQFTAFLNVVLTRNRSEWDKGERIP